MGLRGNEKVDERANTALKKGNLKIEINISKAEVKCEIWKGQSNVAR